MEATRVVPDQTADDGSLLCKRGRRTWKDRRPTIAAIFHGQAN